MKIGILTMYYRRNYGGVLQSYALYQSLKKLGHDVEIINYKVSDAVNSYHPIYVVQYIYNKVKVRLLSKEKTFAIKTKPLSKEVLQIFSDFKTAYLQYSKNVTIENLPSVVNAYDIVILGSDQIWNSMNKKQLVYFGDFGKNVKCRIIAYAPCSIYNKAPFYNKLKLNKLLCGFKALSVRDLTTAQLVENIIGNKPQIVADPTVLHDFEEFAKPVMRNERYVFAYILGSEIKGGHKAALNKIFTQSGKMKVIAIVVSDVSLEAEKFADEVLYSASPGDWVNLVANAQYVYTDSFHGTMFAMKFHKPFLAYYKDVSRASRLLDIKQTYNIHNIISEVEEFDSEYTINYTLVDEKLEEFRKLSINYLTQALD